MPRLKMQQIITGLLIGAVIFIAEDKPAVQAASVSYSVTAKVPAATGVSIQAFSADPANPNVLNAVGTTTLNFGTLAFNPTLGIFLPNIFFAIDVSATGGAGAPDVTVSYSQTTANNPNSIVGRNGLGHKATATFTRVEFGATPADTKVIGLSTHGPKKLLKDVSESIDETEISPGILRIYLGIVSFDNNATFKDPVSGEVFTTGDQPGDYVGTLVVSATVD